MADDAGALMVRSGLVTSSALDDARARVAAIGGTLGEQLVTSGAIADDTLTDFYRSRLLVPQVNPNMLARLTPKVVSAIPSDMAIELRAIPVSFDGENNLTVAMSDPSDRHAVDEIAFFTGAYVVRAVATQMQIAWCLAHYYGHVTALGQRLLQTSQADAPGASIKAAAAQPPRTKGLTGKVNATRHRAIAPVTGPVDVLRPNSGQLDLRPFTADAGPNAGSPGLAVQPPGSTPIAPGRPGLPAATPPPGSVSVARPVATRYSDPIATAEARAAKYAESSPKGLAVPASSAANADAGLSGAAGAELAQPSPMNLAGGPPATSAPRAIEPDPGGPPDEQDEQDKQDEQDEQDEQEEDDERVTTMRRAAVTPPPGDAPASDPVAASLAHSSQTPPPAVATSSPRYSVPIAEADMPTLIPGVYSSDEDALPTPVLDDEPSARIASAPNRTDAIPEKPRARSVSGEIRVPVRRAPSIKPPPPSDDDDEPQIVIERAEAEITSRTLPPRRRAVKSHPPELYARAGEVDLKSRDDRAIDVDEPRIVIDEHALAPSEPTDVRGLDLGGSTPPISTIEVLDDEDTGAVIHDRIVDRDATPILLDRRRASEQLSAAGASGSATSLPTLPREPPTDDDDDDDTGEVDVVVLDAPKKPRPERRTQLGVQPAPVQVRSRDGEAAASRPPVLPGMPVASPYRVTARPPAVEDPTMIDLPAAPPGEDMSSDQLAAPPAPVSDADTNPHIVAAPPLPAPPAARLAAVARAVIVDDPDDDEDDDENLTLRGPRTQEMTAVELDDAIPERTSQVNSDQLLRRRIDHDPVDDGWGPPGTTIPPPLLGAIPGTDDDGEISGAIPMPNIDSSPLIVGPPSTPSAGDPAGRAFARALEDATARAIEVIRQLERAQSRDEVVNIMIAHLMESHHRAGFLVTRHAVSKGPGELGVFAMTPRPATMPVATIRLDRPSTLQDVVGTRLPYRGPMHDEASRGFLIAVLGACPPEILLVPVAVRERVVGVVFGEHRMRHTFDDQLALPARAAGMALERILRTKRG